MNNPYIEDIICVITYISNYIYMCVCVTSDVYIYIYIYTILLTPEKRKPQHMPLQQNKIPGESKASVHIINSSSTCATVSVASGRAGFGGLGFRV